MSEMLFKDDRCRLSGLISMLSSASSFSASSTTLILLCVYCNSRLPAKSSFSSWSITSIFISSSKADLLFSLNLKTYKRWFTRLFYVWIDSEVGVTHFLGSSASSNSSKSIFKCSRKFLVFSSLNALNYDEISVLLL